ncbi:cyclic nucleotide-binding domain-containing protein [Streptomyces sp. JH002]|uniref:cyclic nucleotide-binding domain-containing protein n=1 Tax=Streptomyces TaxID=1883 RepID=UPI00367C811E
MTAPTGFLAGLDAGHRTELLSLTREVRYPPGTRIFDEGEPADAFWIIEEGAVALDVHVPGRVAPVIETLAPGDLLGWSWLFPPYEWHLGARTLSPVTARRCDAAAVLTRCETDPPFGYDLARAVGGVVGQRLKATRIRLLDLYGPHQGGTL